MAQGTILIVCPTSHMDWDWTSSFEEYYKTSKGNSTPGNSNGVGPVQKILNAAASLFTTESSFYFNVAELGWLQRYLQDEQQNLFGATNLSLMGGAITSPDNIVCDGEVFVRAYLVGRQWAQSVGLASKIANVSWMPDDFGHDPELPVILSAMGLTAVAFARIPGAFPNYNLPAAGGSSLACSLMANGVAFNWQASDNSAVFAHFMPDTYGVPGSSQGQEANVEAWTNFLQSQFLSASTSYNNVCSSLSTVVWPGDIVFAPAGGDFSVPDSGWVDGVNNLNLTNTTAKLGTFPDYVSAVQSSTASLTTMPFDPSNFWTGYFGSRPELKILQARASRDLQAAEAVSCLLRLRSRTSSAALDSLDATIEQVWNILAPSSHHDFVTGTSPDRVYKMEQLPMLSLAAGLARNVYQRGIKIIADSINLESADTVVTVHNAVAVARSGIFKLDQGSAVTFEGTTANVQSLPGGGLLVQAPPIQSLGYTSGLVKLGQPDAPKPPVTYPSGSITIDNGTIAIIISSDQRWAMTSIGPSGTNTNVLPSNSPANYLEIYNDSGNLYQYGNEIVGGTFQAYQNPFVAGSAVQTEFGPLRWRVVANLTGTGDIPFVIEYSLVVGEPMVRMKVTGSAPSGSSVMTSFPAKTTDGSTNATHLIYGTAHHFHDDAVPAYWPDPTFKATHNFLMPAADEAGVVIPLAAIYHSGMPAWACYNGTMLGSLFRNTDGSQRGAAGTDSDTHTQRYTLHIANSPLDPAQGVPLIEALQVTTPLRAELASPGNHPEDPITLPQSTSLASASAPALIRATRPMGEPKTPEKTHPQGQVAIRLYMPNANGTEAPVQVTMPVLHDESEPTAELVTALEEPIAGAPVLSFTNVNELTVPTKSAITTVAVTATRRHSSPTNGKNDIEDKPLRLR